MAQEAEHTTSTQAPTPARGASGENPQRGVQRRPAVSPPAPRGGVPTGPFSLMRRFSDDMDRLFSSFFGPNPFRTDWAEALAGPVRELAETAGWPEIEVKHDGNKLTVMADLPGLKKEDVRVEVLEGELRISGERRSESERNEGGYYHTERVYGSFRRSIPLPEGAQPDTASATFDNGVLKIEMDAPSGKAQSARRIEVREGNPH